MDLYKLYPCKGRLKIEKLIIYKETPKTYTVVNERCRLRILKNELPHKVSRNSLKLEIITSDVEDAKKLWNKICEDEILDLERRIDKYKNLLTEV